MLDLREMKIGDAVKLNIVDNEKTLHNTSAFDCDGGVRYVKKAFLGRIENFWDYGQRVKIKFSLDDGELRQIVVDKPMILQDNQLYVRDLGNKQC